MIDWSLHPGEIITVISDLHSNKRAIASALEAVKQKRTDKLIILGDILTYGIDAIETMDLVQKAIDGGAELIMGNHDEIYLDLIVGKLDIFSRLRPDLQETISYNLKLIDKKQFASWPWKKELIYNNVYWEYIKDREDFQVSGMKLRKMKHLAGVFGHTHRAACFGLLNGFLPSINGLDNDTFVINPGSVGQPRSSVKRATLLRLSSHNNRLWAEIEMVPYDIRGHIDDLSNSSLSDATKKIMMSYFQ